MVASRCTVATAAWCVVGLVAGQQTGNHPDWPRWCGKVYEAGYPNFDPGGQTVEPAKLSAPALHVQVKPRYSLYLESESEGEFIVSTEISQWFGEAWPNLTAPETAPKVWFNINLVSNNDILVENSVAVNTSGNVFSFDLSKLEPSMEPYEVVFFGATETGEPNITVTSELWYLPEKSNGSVTKLDNLNGGLMFRNPISSGFKPLMPYGFYASYDGFLRETDYLDRVRAYHGLGLNAMIPLTTVWDSRPAFEFLDELDLKFMYDLRSYYKNLTAVRDQVTAIKDYDALFGYWGSDEPDGWQDPFNATILSRDVIRSIDPYHAVSVTLNCQDYYFKEYTAGADFIMEDVYPIGINSTFSKWGTECNVTHGDCGCDNCQGNVQDVANRLDDLAKYERWEGLWPKTKLHNPQSFHGENYWQRDPTVDEEVAMNALALNHGAKGIISWVWPTSDDLAAIHGQFAKVVATLPASEFIVQGAATRITVPDMEIIDVSYWSLGNRTLVCVVNGGYVDIERPIAVPFPANVKPTALRETVWGEGAWQLLGFALRTERMKAMSASMVIIDTADG